MSAPASMDERNKNGTPHQMGAIRVFRIEDGESMIVRILSTEYGGVFTHFYRGRSHLCTGKDCHPMAHKERRIWKGYCAAERHMGGTTWHPICLEISESLELDFRDVFARGQLWEIWRDMPVEKKRPPTQGKLLEERGPDSCPQAFNYLPVLIHIFHVEHVDLTHRNPLPPRLMLEASQGEAPKVLQKRDEDKPITPEEYERKKKEWEARKRSPSDKPKY